MSENLNDAESPVSGADPRKIAMSDFEVSSREELVAKGAYVPVVVPYYDKYTADGHERPAGDFDNLGKNYIFPLDRNGNGGGGGMTPEEVQEIVDTAVGQEEQRAIGAEGALSGRIDSETGRAADAEEELSRRIDSLGASAFIGRSDEPYYVLDGSSDGGDSSAKVAPYIFDILEISSTGTDYTVTDRRLICRAGWYHVDATFRVGRGGEAPVPTWASLGFAVGVNGVFSDFRDYDRVEIDQSHDGEVIRHISTVIHVPADGSSVDFTTNCINTGIVVYLDQISLYRVSVTENGGGGSSESNVVIVDVGPYRDNAKYEEIAGHLLDGKIVAVRFPALKYIAAMESDGSDDSLIDLVPDVVTFIDSISGVPQGYTKEEALQFLKQNGFSFNFDFKWRGLYGLIQYEFRCVLPYSEEESELQPLMYEVVGAFGFRNGFYLDLIYDTDDLNTAPFVYYVKLSDGVYAIDYEKFTEALAENWHRGYKLALTVSSELYNVDPITSEPVNAFDYALGFGTVFSGVGAAYASAVAQVDYAENCFSIVYIGPARKQDISYQNIRKVIIEYNAIFEITPDMHLTKVSEEIREIPTANVLSYSAQ